MNVIEIIVASCLLLGPLMAGVLLGKLISRAYTEYNDFWGRGCSDLYYFMWNESWEYTVGRINIFWVVVGAMSGGFLSGVFVQRILGLWEILS